MYSDVENSQTRIMRAHKNSAGTDRRKKNAAIWNEILRCALSLLGVKAIYGTCTKLTTMLVFERMRCFLKTTFCDLADRTFMSQEE